MFTPQEVKERSENLEKAVFGGYSVGAVEELLTPLAEDYAALYKENATLKSKLKVLAEKIEEYRGKEEEISSALLAAQKTADGIVSDAQRKSARMLTESEEKLRARHQELMLEINAEQERVTMAKQAAAKFIVEIEDRVEAQLTALEKIKQMDLTAHSGEKADGAARAASGRKPVPKAPPKDPQAQKSAAKEIGDNISRLLEQTAKAQPAPAASKQEATQVIKPVK